VTETATSGLTPRSPRIPSLDGLRALSIAIVLFSHAGRPGDGPLVQFLDSLTLEGHLGVDVFFVISGYLITRLLVEELRDGGRLSLGRFYLRRTLRILPPFWVYLSVVGALLIAGKIVLPIAELRDAALFVFNYRDVRYNTFWVSQTWSLSLEEQFYLLWPPLLAVFGLRGAPSVASVLLVLTPIARVVLAFAVPTFSARIDWMLPTRLDVLMFGCLAAILEGTPTFEALLSWAFRRRLHWLAWLMLPVTGFLTHRLGGRYLFSVGYSIESVSITLMLAHAIRAPHGFIGRVLNARPLVWLGQRSYSLYLWQQPFLIPNNTTWTGRFPVNLVCAVLAAELSWRLVERPFNRLRRALEPTVSVPVPRETES
jgi:peptidoglycan/LPS O-acetylase OafA/YrhL